METEVCDGKCKILCEKWREWNTKVYAMCLCEIRMDWDIIQEGKELLEVALLKKGGKGEWEGKSESHK